MGETALVSIIVPVYNTRDYLEGSIDSLCGQTYANLQIILVDDGSTDGSGEVCDAYARKDPRVQVIHQPNGGVSSARNAGLDAARGEYVCFADSDDRVLETFVEEMTGTLQKEDCDLCVGGIMVRDEKDESNSYKICYPQPTLFKFPTRLKKQRFLCRWILYSRFGWSACSQMFRRDIIERHHLRFEVGQKVYEDIDFFFRYVSYCRNLRYIPKLFYDYRQHSDSTIHTTTRQELIYWMLRLARIWEHSLTGQSSFPPSYICAGVTYIACGLVKDIPRTEEDKRKLAQAFASFRAAKNGEWLVGQARLALRNWVKIIWVCGLGLGLRVCGFYKSISDGNIAVFQGVNWLRICYDILQKLLPTGSQKNTIDQAGDSL